MANILLTTYCNRKCKYCFAQSKVELGKQSGDASRNMSMENFEKVIGFFKESRLKKFSILGGEPTLHPEFNAMVDRVLREKEFKNVVIFSNGLMPRSVLKHLCKNDDARIRVALNLNPEQGHTPSQWRKVNETMEALGGRIGLGINIYTPGQEYDYIIEAINTYHLSTHIRVGLTHPIVGSDNIYAHEADFSRIAEDLVIFAEKVFKNKLTFSFDCGFQFCMFTLDQHKELLRFGIRFRSLCDPIIDIGPDLSLWRCFPLFKNIAGYLDDFSLHEEIISHYENRYYRTIQDLGNRLECPQCIYRQNGLCKGGCLARSMISFHQEGAVGRWSEN